MAVKLMNMDKDKVLLSLETLFGKGSKELKIAGLLIAGGYVVDFTMFTFKITISPEVVFNLQLPKPAPSILSGTMTAEEKSTMRHVVANVLAAAIAHVEAAGGNTENGLTSEQVEPETGTLVEEAEKAKQEPFKYKQSWMKQQLTEKEQAAAKIAKDLDMDGLVNALIPLKDAKAIGQKCKGTNEGAIYRAVAIGSLNVGVKFTPGSDQIGVRVECPGTWDTQTKKRLATVGFSDNGMYMSMHINLDGVPAMRTIGAILYSMETNFSKMASTKEFLGV